MPPRFTGNDDKPKKVAPITETTKDLRDASAPRSRNQVTVACKLPNGLVLRLFEKITVWESTPTGPMQRPEYRPLPNQVTLNGCALPFGKIAEYAISMGYALTQVDKEFWDKWVEQNKDSDLLKNRVLFAYERSDDVSDRIKEQHEAGVKSGLEPINPKKPPIVGIRPADNRP